MPQILIVDDQAVLEQCLRPDESQRAGMDAMLKDMETLLARMG
jgi:hypothetical protein